MVNHVDGNPRYIEVNMYRPMPRNDQRYIQLANMLTLGEHIKRGNHSIRKLWSLVIGSYNLKSYIGELSKERRPMPWQDMRAASGHAMNGHSGLLQ